MIGRSTLALMMAVSVVGCGEKPQTAGQGPVKKSDAKAWAEAQNSAYVDAGYKPGDKAAWEAHLKARTERGQNEYTRTQK
jgi:hypothetical protein